MKDSKTLISCCVTLLKLLIRLYRKNRISLEHFKNNSYQKIAFLQQNKKSLNKVKKEQISSLINEYNDILNS